MILLFLIDLFRILRLERGLFIPLGIISIFPIALFSLSGDKLQQKLEQPIPEWMKRQIAADLEPFREQGASRKAIEETTLSVYKLPRGSSAQFVRYEISNNQITCSSTTEDLSDARIVHFLLFFQEMAKYLLFPDMAILTSIWDNFDSPLLLHACKGAVFSICKRNTNSQVILIPEVRNYDYYEGSRQALLEASPHFPWEQRTPIAFWRGNTTGGYYHYYEWDYKPRPQLVLFSKAHPDLVDARFTGTYYLEDNVKWMFETLDLFAPWDYLTGQLQYKYLIAVDGNSFPSSLKWQMLSGSAILKNNSDFIEWFYGALLPYVHYVPYHPDCSDLNGQITWLQHHDKEAKNIANNALEFARNHLTLEDIALYYYHLFSAFAALQHEQS